MDHIALILIGSVLPHCALFGAQSGGQNGELNCEHLRHLRMGEAMTGPLPLMTSNSMPRAGSGVRMSLNMITPSGRKASHGCIDNSIAISAVSDRSLKGILSENLQTGQQSAMLDFVVTRRAHPNRIIRAIHSTRDQERKKHCAEAHFTF